MSGEEYMDKLWIFDKDFGKIKCSNLDVVIQELRSSKEDTLNKH